MAHEFRQIARSCDILPFPRNPDFAVFDDPGLPDQLVEVLPIPATAQDPASWANWYYCKVFADDGIRFTEGMVERRFTKPIEVQFDAESFTLECFDAASFASVNATNLLAVATYLSGAQNIPPRASSAAGPFLFLEKNWANIIAREPDLGLTPSDRFDPDRQPAAAAAEAADIRQQYHAAGLPDPGAAELAFGRLFGSQSVDLLIASAQQPASPDPAIDVVIGTYCSGELGRTLTPTALVNEIAAAFPDLLGPADARSRASEVLQRLRTALDPHVTRARATIAPLDPQPQPPAGGNPGGGAGNLRLGVNAVFQNEIVAAATQCNMDPAGLASLIDAEAAKLHGGLWDKNSTNPISTAVGLTQFLRGSWIFMATQSWSTLNKSAKASGLVDANNRVTDPAALLALRTDPALSIMSAAEYAASNLKFVTRRNPPYPSFYNPDTPDGKMRLAYLCHHEGPGGALKYLRDGKPRSYVAGLNAYIDRKIVPSRFRSAVTVVGPGPDLSAERSTTGPSTSLTPGNGSIPTNAVPVPIGEHAVDFAGLRAPVAQWHWPVITGDTEAMKISYRTGPSSVAGKPSREFLANRQGGRRFHVGMDLFCHQGDVVLAIADGTIVKFYPFYEGTNALFVAHDGVVVNYGEVAPDSDNEFGWREGDRVTAGQQIAKVGRLNMIHFETYRPGTTKNARWMRDGSAAPSNLLNPTNLLLGLAVRGIRKLG